MKAALLLALLLWQPAPNLLAGDVSHRNFRYERTITLAPALASGPSCAILDPAIFAHAGLSLKDLRLFQGSREVPYAITLSEPAQPDADPAFIRNLGLRNRAVVFDLEMPRRPYTDVVLDLAGEDFFATARVSGTRNSNYSNQISLGEFTLFDLTSQHLSRSTTLPLQETDLPYLHVELSVSPAVTTGGFTPQTLLKMVQGASVPPSREAQSVYSTAANSTVIKQEGRQSVASFPLPQRIPVERVSFDLDPGFKDNFSRGVHITDHPESAQIPAFKPPDSVFKRRKSAFLPPNSADGGGPSSETLAGSIFRVHLSRAGREISQQELSVPATLGSNMQSPAMVQIAVDNGDDTPLPLTAIRLEIRQRKLCFEAQAGAPHTLFYGDPTLPAPEYDYGRLWNPAAPSLTAQLGPEQRNPAYRTPPDGRPFLERHPHLLWVVLIGVLCLLFAIAVRSSRLQHAK